MRVEVIRIKSKRIVCVFNTSVLMFFNHRCALLIEINVWRRKKLQEVNVNDYFAFLGHTYSKDF